VFKYKKPSERVAFLVLGTWVLRTQRLPAFLTAEVAEVYAEFAEEIKELAQRRHREPLRSKPC
jgi:hypothetical protein